MEGIPQQIFINKHYSTSMVIGAHGPSMCKTETYAFLVLRAYVLVRIRFYTVLLKDNLLDCGAKKYWWSAEEEEVYQL